MRVGARERHTLAAKPFLIEVTAMATVIAKSKAVMSYGALAVGAL